MNDKVEGKDGSGVLQAAGVGLLCIGQGFKGLRRVSEDAPRSLASVHFFGSLSIFSGLLHESLFPRLRQTQWYALGKFRVYFVLINTYKTMFQVSDVNIADEFLRGDCKSDLSLLFISACVLSIVAALRVNRIQNPRVTLQLTIYFLLTDDTE